MENKQIVDIYIRVSTKEQVEGFSIGEQEERLRKYADAHGWIINAVLPDGGFSGGNMDRPALRQLIDDAKKHKINKVVVYKLDRLSRSQKDTLYLIEEVFLANGVDFVSMTETLDTSTPFGIAMIGILSVFAQLERSTIAERMMLGRDARVRTGLLHGNSNDVIGYKYDKHTNTLTQDEYDATIVRRIFTDYANGKSASQLTRELNQIHWRGCASWNALKIKRILTQPLYIGKQRWKGEEYIVENCPCIVTDELFEQVQNEMARRSGERGHTTNHLSLLGGMIWCGRCGKRYSATVCQYKGHKYYRYYCSSTRARKLGLPDANCHNRGWGEDELNNIVINAIKQLKVRIDHAEQLQSQRQQQYAEELNALKNRLNTLDKQNEKIVELFSLGIMDAATIKRRADAIAKERDSIEKQIDELKKPTGLLSIEDAKDKLTSLENIMDSNGTEQIKHIIHQLITSITLTDDNVDIVWNFDV